MREAESQAEKWPLSIHTDPRHLRLGYGRAETRLTKPEYRADAPYSPEISDANG
ncbi:MAG: hypothetical protein ABF629_09295 [Sporolactobacillus sp.]|uniref:hypothetical protein n=1 Tax=Sporolactobacillus sp. STSJ-5 TaxID=2965076 RepID=UPI002102F920|nr:hypothetical protein [Sporolactobacillus sp. STSJ-5]MCQ2011456.1 hypothetical protein [Sporolactobacillus sp. STSJ-5]